MSLSVPKTGFNIHANGSAIAQLGANKSVVSVYGPVGEKSGDSLASTSKGTIELLFNHPCDKQDYLRSDIELLHSRLLWVMNSVVDTTVFPGSVVTIVVDVIAYDAAGPGFECCLYSCLIALSQSGCLLRYIPVCLSDESGGTVLLARSHSNNEFKVVWSCGMQASTLLHFQPDETQLVSVLENESILGGLVQVAASRLGT